MAKIRIDTDLLYEAFPEIRNLHLLPRKKKKAMKKKISRMLINTLTLHSELILAEALFRETLSEMNDIQNQIEDL